MVKCCASLTVFIFCISTTCAQINYPYTPKMSQTDDYHGIKIEDPYRWLENDTSEQTRSWVNEQNKLTEEYLSSIPFRGKLKKRMIAFYNYPRFSTPYRVGSYYYFFKNDGLQNYPTFYRQNGLDGEPEVVVDPNGFSDSTIQLTDVVVSKDGRYAAWGVSRGGSDWETFYVRDLNTMKDLPDSVSWLKVSEIAWQKNGFYYSRYPQPAKGMELSSKNENHQVWYHNAGTDQSQDRLIYSDSSHPYRFHHASTSEDERYVFLSIRDPAKGLRGNALYYSDSWSDDKSFRPIVPEIGEYIYGVIDPIPGNKFLIQTNHKAPNSKVMRFDPLRPQMKHWKTIIPEKDEPLEIASMAGGKLFVQYLKDVTSRVEVHSLNGRRNREIKLPGPGNTDGFTGLRDDNYVFYSFNSLNYPTHIYSYEIKTGKSTLFRKPAIRFDPNDYVTTQQFFVSRDGTQVPMFIVYKKGIKLNWQNPLLLYGYGGFNISMIPKFNTSMMPWLEQGGIFAMVNLRGGSEYGEKWHEAGMLDKKQNVFNDFISAAEYLLQKKYTTTDKLAIWGSSNGGLLVGTVMNQRPELFKVAIPEVGVMDMLRFQKFTIGWNWIAEYGSSDNENDFNNLLAYSPLHNIKSGVDYPATLIITADHDDRVVPAHSFKYGATLQEKSAGKNPVLIRIHTNSGHGTSTIMKNIEQASDIFSFILFNMGVTWKDTD